MLRHNVPKFTDISSLMTASLMNGTEVAAGLIQDIKAWVKQEPHCSLRRPGLAVILLGDDAPSSIYVHKKRQICQEVGFQSFAYDLPAHTSEAALISLINSLNDQEEVDGILVQLPLPAHINTKKIIECIHPNKDVDGFHPFNLGRLAQGNPWLRPCTSFGIIQLLAHYRVSLKGKNVVIVGASNIVGRPMALECLLAYATVTICHRATSNLDLHIKGADIVIAAAGVYDVVKAEWLSQNQIMIDVGIHREDNGIIHGDLDFDNIKERVALITPVPGGVGPMTIATLLQNTKQAYQINLNLPS